MLLSRTQRIILVAGVGVALLLLIGVIALSCTKARAVTDVPSPSPSPEPTETPSPSPFVTPSPEPTETPQYRLPLVPHQGGTEPPAAILSTGAPAEASAIPPAPTANPTDAPTKTSVAPSALIEGRFDGGVRDFVAVGTESGEPVAVLLVRLAPPDLWVVSVPYETLPLEAGTNATSTEQSRQEKNATAQRIRSEIASGLGLRLDRSLTLDLTCAGELLAAVPTLSGGGMTFDEPTVTELMESSGEKRAYGMGALGAGIANLFSTVSPWSLPALREATRGKISAELNLWELIGLAMAFRGVRRADISVLPTETVGSTLVLAPAARAVLQRTFS